LFPGKKDTTAINYRCRLLSFIFSLYLSHIRDTLIRQAQVVINEVADVAIPASACGNSSGYIELYNRFSTITEFISGYTLSVDSTYSLLFPSGTTIPPNSFRLICLAGIIGGNSVVKLTAGVNVRSSVKLQNGGSTSRLYLLLHFTITQCVEYILWIRYVFCSFVIRHTVILERLKLPTTT
jgi:hypothetical protein